MRFKHDKIRLMLNANIKSPQKEEEEEYYTNNEKRKKHQHTFLRGINLHCLSKCLKCIFQKKK